MISGHIRVKAQKKILYAAVLATLLITPRITLDSINITKLFVLSIFGFMLAVPFFFQVRSVSCELKRILFIPATMFFISLLASFLFNGASWDQLYGDYGRNTGFLAYACLLVFLLVTASVSSRSFGQKILAALMLVTVANVLYGGIQHFGLDPIDWQNPYNPITGTLGNPNFTSSLIGIGAVSGLSFLVGNISAITRIFLSFFVVGAILLIYLSDASQGIFVFLAGSILIYFYRFIRDKKPFLRYLFGLMVTASVLIGILGILQRGPLAGLFYQDSVTYRGDYWRAGWKMTLENPIFGVGLDNYGDYYRASRTLEAALRRGPDITSNSAHNVFLDISSFGGFPLLIAYLLIVFLAIRSGYRLLKRSKQYDFVAVGLSAAYLGYLLQSVVSINQLGLAIWGWVLPGAIIGYEINSRDSTERAHEVHETARDQRLPAKATLLSFLGMLAGFLIVIGPVQKDAAFHDALSKQSASAILEATLSWPRNVYYLEFASRIFAENEMNKNALNLSKLAVSHNPRNFRSWEAIYENPISTLADKKRALARMRELDPFNFNLK